MKNDIQAAKEFRNEYFKKLNHELNDNTVILLMIEYAAVVSNGIAPSVDVDQLVETQAKLLKDHQNALLNWEKDKEELITRVKEIQEKDKEIQKLTEKIANLEKKEKSVPSDENSEHKSKKK